MRIVHIITRLIRGGAQKVLVSLVKDQLDRGGEVHLLFGTDERAEGSLEEEARDTGANLIEVSSLRRRESPLHDVKALFDLYREVRKLRPNIVHTHTSKAGVLGRIAAGISGVPGVVHTPHGCIFATNGNIPDVSNRPLMKSFFYWIERFSEPFADRIVAISESEREEFQKRNIGNRSPFPVIFDGVSDEHLGSGDEETGIAQELDLPLDRFVIGCMGRLSREKGQDLLIDAVAEFDETEQIFLLLIGSGPRREFLERKVRELGLEQRVRFTGFVRHPQQFWPLMDCYVQPSRYEGFGLATVEAMAAGVPVIVSKTGGLQELVEDEVSGLLVSPGDANDLREAIQRLKNESTLRSRIAENAGQRAIEKFSARRMGEEYWNLYERVVGVRGGGTV